jgi:transcriptional regulator with XRE-family HTH domain
MTPALCRAARSLLGWRQIDLAKKAGMSRKTVTDLELEIRNISPNTIGKLKAAFKSAGVQIEDDGLRLLKRRDR